MLPAVPAPLPFALAHARACSKLEHSTIMYEASDMSALLRLDWNQQDPHYMATLHMDDNAAVIVDIRCSKPPARRTRSLTLPSRPQSASRASLCAALAQCVRERRVLGTAVLVPHLHRVGRPARIHLGLDAHAFTSGWCARARAHACAFPGVHLTAWACVRADPILAYAAETEINSMKWYATNPDWLSIGYGSHMQVLRV